MDWRKIGRQLLFPPLWLLLLLVIASAVLLTLVFVQQRESDVIACLVYVLSFYTLTAVCFFCWMVLPKRYRQIKQQFRSTAFGSRFSTDRTFRVLMSLSLSLTINLLYVGIQVWFWIWNHSWWFVVLAGYYTIMAVIRLLMLCSVRRNQIGIRILAEWHRARLCAYILLLVNLSLSGAVLMILYQNRGYDYPGIMIYVMALYTFYSAIHTAVDMVRYRKLGSPLLSAVQIVSLSAALVSVLNLETAMFAQFGRDMSVWAQHLFIILTGAGISITMVTLSVLLIIRATKEIRRKKYGS